VGRPPSTFLRARDWLELTVFLAAIVVLRALFDRPVVAWETLVLTAALFVAVTGGRIGKATSTVDIVVRPTAILFCAGLIGSALVNGGSMGSLGLPVALGGFGLALGLIRLWQLHRERRGAAQSG
jgi:hypothetical protein